MSNQIFLIVPATASDAAADWWGHGGAELMDEIDPGCATEAGGAIGPFESPEDADRLGAWWERARKVPGWAQTGMRIIGRVLLSAEGSPMDLEIASADIGCGPVKVVGVKR